jgi:hypothetical protein
VLKQNEGVDQERVRNGIQEIEESTQESREGQAQRPIPVIPVTQEAEIG